MKITYKNLLETIDQKVKSCQLGTDVEGSPIITREDYDRIKQEIYDNADSALKQGFRMFDNTHEVTWSKNLCAGIGTYRYIYRVMVVK